MKRIRKVLAFTIASVMLVNTSYVQSSPVFATELQNESQPTEEMDSDSARSVSETGSPENEVTSESPDKGNQPEAEPGTSNSGGVRDTSEDSSEESSQGTEQAVSADSNESQPSAEMDSDSAGSVSETGTPENEAASESPDKGNQPEAEPGISNSEDVRETSEDSAKGSSQGTKQAVPADSEESSEKEYGESSDDDKAGKDSVPEESGTAKTDTDPAAAASEKEEDTFIPNVRTQYKVRGTGLMVTADLSDPEAVPDDAELIVEELESPEGELSYALYFRGIPEDQNNKKLGGEPIQLDLESGSVKIRMAFSDEQLKKILKTKAGGDLVVYDADGEQLAAEVSLEEELVSFDAASLLRVRIVNRKYGVKEESKRVRYATTSDGVEVTAVLTDAAAIPDDAELVVAKIGESESELVYDISFMGPEKDESDELTGNTVKYEPEKGTVSVTIKFLEQQLTEKLGVEDAGELTVIHIPDGEAPESVETTVLLGAETIAFELESFSTLIIGKSTDDPNPFTPPEGHASFTDNGGNYEVGSTLQYLLEHFQIIMSDNAKLDALCMGSVLIGGDLSGSGSGFANDLKSAQNVSSYIAGSVADFAGTSGSRIPNHDLAPLYVGPENVIIGIDTQGAPNYTVAGKPNYNQTDSNDGANNVYTSDDYVDWEHLYQVIREESQMLLKQGATGRPAVSDDGKVLTITAGQQVTIESLEGVEQINIIGDITASVNTLINLLDSGEINMPVVTINGSDPGTGESGEGTAYVWNIPNAVKINLPSGNFLGHLIAPDAFIKQTSGQYTGGLIAKKIETGAQGHSYRYNGGKLIGSEEGFAANKVFAGGVWPEGTTYTIQMTAMTEGAPLPEKTSVVLTQDNPTDEFGDLHFDPIKDKNETVHYRYRVEEVKPGDSPDDIGYDTSYYNIDVEVQYSGSGDDWKAEIKQTKVSKNGGEWGVIPAGKQFTFGFTNKYNIDTTASLKATKEIAGNNWKWADHPNAQFTFRVTPNPGSPMPEGMTVLEGTATVSHPTVVFDEISFDTVGIYSYVISEVIPEDSSKRVPGIVYDKTKHYAYVNVEYVDGELAAAVTYDGGDDELKITNTSAEAKAALQVTKDFNDWGKADSFTFNLAAVTEGAPMPEDTTAAASEDAPTAVFGEITFEKTGVYEYTITEVNDGADGVTYDTTPHRVVVTVSKAGDDTNALTADVKYDGADSLIITNTYASTKAEIKATKNFNAWNMAESFTFNLAAVTEGAPMPEDTTAVATKDDVDAKFGEIIFEKAGTYEYTITEVNDGVKGVTYDTAPHSVVVTVTKAEDATNALTADVKYDGADALIITNTLSGAKAALQVTKDFDDWGKADRFTFNLAAVTKDAPMPAKTTAFATKAAPTAVFEEINYNVPGTYEYTITEVNDGADGVTYDTTPHKAVVTVTKDEDNKLTAVAKYDDADSLIITNTYASTKAEIKATKQFNDWSKADSFTFNLAAVTEGAPMPENTAAVATKDAVDAKFGEIIFEKAGTYEYTITEVNDGVEGVTYDTAPHSVVVTVTKAEDDTNALTAEVKYDGADALVITSTFAGAKTTLQATKAFNDWGRADSFTFNLAAVTEGAPMPENTTAVATEDAPTAVFGEITYEKTGTYEYTIAEVNDGADGVTYDTAPHSVVVTVTKAEDNRLTAVAKYDGADSLTITNTYTSTKPEIKAAKAEIKATKRFNDWSKAESFTFNLAAVTEDAPMPANTKAIATKDAVTTNFGEITFEKAGVYEYTITEENSGIPYVTYDTAQHKVVVTVTRADDETNALTAAVSYDGEASLTITNKYEAKCELVIRKAFAGYRVQVPPTLSFTVKGPNRFEQTVYYTEFINGSYSFKNLEPGTYTVTENNANVSGYVLTTTYTVNGAAVQKADVKLEPNVTGKINITNTYNKEEKHTPKKSPKTGDTTNAAVPIVAGTLSLLLIVYILLSNKKRRDAE